jgi:hypothetical protein
MLRREVLAALRDMSHRQEATSSILKLDLEAVARRTGVSVQLVKSELTDLLTQGLAEAFAESFTDRASDGHCRITDAGLAEFRRLQ